METEPFDADELEIASKAYALSLESKAFAPAAEYLPASERLRERGWLSRRMRDIEGLPTAIYELTAQARTALGSRFTTQLSPADLN